MKTFGPPPSVTEQLRAMKPQTDKFVKTTNQQTVFVVASRLKVESREFTCRKKPGGVHVWCLK